MTRTGHPERLPAGRQEAKDLSGILWAFDPQDDEGEIHASNKRENSN